MSFNDKRFLYLEKNLDIRNFNAFGTVYFSVHVVLTDLQYLLHCYVQLSKYCIHKLKLLKKTTNHILKKQHLKLIFFKFLFFGSNISSSKLSLSIFHVAVLNEIVFFHSIFTIFDVNCFYPFLTVLFHHCQTSKDFNPPSLPDRTQPLNSTRSDSMLKGKLTSHCTGSLWTIVST